MTANFIHPLAGFVEKTFVITEFEVRKLRHDFTELITRALFEHGLDRPCVPPDSGNH